MKKVTWYIIGAIITLWVLAPVFLLALSTFVPVADVNLWPKSFIPQRLSLEPIVILLKVHKLPATILNSLYTAVGTVLLSLLLGLPAGYALARFQFRGKKVYQLLILMARMFPMAILAVPLVIFFIKAGIYDSVLGVTIVHTVLSLPLVVLISSSVFAGIHVEVEEAAVTFGCPRWKAFFLITLPMATPGIAAASIFTFLASWNEVFAATLLTLRERTLPAFFITILAEAPLYMKFAGGLLMLVPAVLFLIAARKYLFRAWT